MGSLFNVDNAFFSFMGKLWDMLCLSIIWVILCVYCFVLMLFLFSGSDSYMVFLLTFALQIITVGPATTALYYTVVKVIRKERGYAIRSFIQSFKLNFKQGAIVGELILLAVYILWVDYQYANLLLESNPTMGQIFYVGSVTLTIILLAVTVFIFPLLSRFTLKIAGLFKTTFLISMKHIFTTILLIIIFAVSALAVYVFPPAIMLIPSVCVLIMSLLIERVFKRYMPKDEKAEESGKDQWYLDN